MKQYKVTILNKKVVAKMTIFAESIEEARVTAIDNYAKKKFVKTELKKHNGKAKVVVAMIYEEYYNQILNTHSVDIIEKGGK